MLTTPSGRPASCEQLSEFHRRDRRRLRRLEDDAVTRRERRRDLPREHEEREVPRNHLANDAQRLRCAARRDVRELVRPAGVIEEVRCRHRHVEVARFADRLATVDRFGHRELTRAVLQQSRDAIDVLAALTPRHVAPRRLERELRSHVRRIDISAGRERDLGYTLLGRRVYRCEVIAALRSDEAAADEEVVARANVRDSRFPVPDRIPTDLRR